MFSVQYHIRVMIIKELGVEPFELLITPEMIVSSPPWMNIQQFEHTPNTDWTAILYAIINE